MYGNFVHPTNDASHYTKPPTINECARVQTSAVHCHQTCLVAVADMLTSFNLLQNHVLAWLRRGSDLYTHFTVYTSLCCRPNVSGDLYYRPHSQTLIECEMQSWSESTLDMILISPTMPSPLLLSVTKDFTCLHNLNNRALIYVP